MATKHSTKYHHLHKPLTLSPTRSTIMGAELRPGKQKDARVRQAEALEAIVAKLDKIIAALTSKPSRK